MPVKWTKPKKERAQRPATPSGKPKGEATKGDSKPKKRAGTPATPGKPANAKATADKKEAK